MYVYVRSEPGLYTVGFYDPDGQWHAESDHESADAAAARVHYLNGGQPPQPDPPEKVAGPRTENWRSGA